MIYLQIRMSNEFGADSEISPREKLLVNAVITGLKAVYQLHESLGDAGRSDLQLNEFGETALVMDFQAENVAISSLKETHLSMQFFSEEHGEFAIGQNPELTVVLDGLDGSDEYKSRRENAMYGTMLSVLDGTNPTYDDYIVSGIMIHSPTPQMFLAIKRKGCFLVDIATGERKQIKKEPKEFSEQTPIDIDVNWPPFKEVFDTNRENFPNMNCRSRSAAARIALFLNGSIDIGLEWSRKKNLEQAVIYGLVNEAGGVHTTADGVGIGDQYFKTFAQGHIPLVVAPSQEMAMQVSDRLGLKRFDL